MNWILDYCTVDKRVKRDSHADVLVMSAVNNVEVNYMRNTVLMVTPRQKHCLLANFLKLLDPKISSAMPFFFTIQYSYFQYCCL